MNALVPIRPKASRASETIPHLEEVSAEYAEVKARRAALVAESALLQQEIVARATAFDRKKSLPADVQEPIWTPVAARVARLLGKAPPAPPPSELEPADVETRMSDIEAAVLTLDRRLDELRMTASAIICVRVEPRYRQIVARICERLLDLHAAMREYQAFVDEMNGKGIAWSTLWPMPVMFIKDHGPGSGSDLHRYLQEAVEHGFISGRDVPEELR